MRIFLFVMLFLTPELVFAQTSSSTVAALGGGDPVALIGLMAKAYREGAYALGSGLLLTLVVWIARAIKLLEWLPQKATRWVATGLAMATSIGVGLTAGQDWLSIVSTGLSVGLTSIGGWEALKGLLKR